MVSLHSKKVLLTLFGYHGSSTTNRIRIALAVKGIPYTFQEVDEGAANEQRSEKMVQYHESFGTDSRVKSRGRY